MEQYIDETVVATQAIEANMDAEDGHNEDEAVLAAQEDEQTDGDQDQCDDDNDDHNDNEYDTNDDLDQTKQETDYDQSQQQTDDLDDIIIAEAVQVCHGRGPTRLSHDSLATTRRSLSTAASSAIGVSIPSTK